MNFSWAITILTPSFLWLFLKPPAWFNPQRFIRSFLRSSFVRGPEHIVICMYVSNVYLVSIIKICPTFFQLRPIMIYLESMPLWHANIFLGTNSYFASNFWFGYLASPTAAAPPSFLWLFLDPAPPPTAAPPPPPPPPAVGWTHGGFIWQGNGWQVTTLKNVGTFSVF